MAPIRALEAPGGVYMKSVEETFNATGTFSQTFHVYQPDASAEGIRFELTAKTSNGGVDSAHTFRSVVLTSRPGEADQTQQTLANAAGQIVYSIPTSRQGWYRFTFSYGAVNAGRTLGFKAYDASGNTLKISWSDPPGANALVRAKVAVEQAARVYLKGGAYRNTSPSEFAYADSIRLNGNLLYRRAFDQGRYNFPLGQLAAGEHTLELNLSASGSNAAKFWFGVNDKSFDVRGTKTSWDAVQFLYYGAMHTGDYDAWSEGVAFAQGSSVTNGVRPPPVRRGTSFALALDHASLNGTSRNAIVRIYPLGSATEVPWTKSLAATDLDYQGGIYTTGGFSARSREHWRVDVPSTAAVGRYVVRVSSPLGGRIGSDVSFYVIHNPYPLVGAGGLSKPELETYAYDEDEDGTNIQSNFGTDQDGFRDHFTVMYEGTDNLYTPWTKITGAFRRTQDEAAFSMLDVAVAAMDGTTSEFESMRRLYRVVSQRLRYNRQDIQDNSSITFLGSGMGGGITPDQALVVSRPNTEHGILQSGQCFDYGTILTALARSSGLVSRVVHSWNTLGGWGNHVFSEVYVPTLPQHGGKVSNSNASANSDTDRWYVFDATDPAGTGVNPRQWTVYSEAIAPRAQYGRAAIVLSGTPVNPFDAVTSTVTWNPLSYDQVTSSGVVSVSAAYQSGPEFWITASGVTGWLGFGEKDVYRINQATVGARSISVRALPSGGEYLVPKLCLGPVTSSPVMPDRCANAAPQQTLPAGESYVVVFNDAEDVPGQRNLRGDSIKYVLELQF